MLQKERKNRNAWSEPIDFFYTTNSDVRKKLKVRLQIFFLIVGVGTTAKTDADSYQVQLNQPRIFSQPLEEFALTLNVFLLLACCAADREFLV